MQALLLEYNGCTHCAGPTRWQLPRCNVVRRAASCDIRVVPARGCSAWVAITVCRFIQCRLSPKRGSGSGPHCISNEVRHPPTLISISKDLEVSTKHKLPTNAAIARCVTQCSWAVYEIVSYYSRKSQDAFTQSRDISGISEAL